MTGDWHLAHPTPAAWARPLVAHRDELLLEQGHLEKKAAAAALAFLFRHPDRHALQRPLARLAREELLHFERVVRLLERRGRRFGPQVPGPYADRLKRVVRAREPDRLLDELLVCAVIEARSCERMGILADALAGADAELAALYRYLVEAEGRHRRVYVDLALDCFSPDEVRARWAVVTGHEAGVLLGIPWAPRLHGACRREERAGGGAMR